MDCVMAPMSSISWSWAFMSLYMWGEFTGNVPWRMSGWSVQSSAWWGTSSQGPGCCGQTDVPTSPAASWPALVPLGATPLGPGGSASQDPVFWEIVSGLSMLLQGGPLVAPSWLEWPYQQLLWQGYDGVGTQAPQADWHPGGVWVYFSIWSTWNHRSSQLGAPCSALRCLCCHVCWQSQMVTLHVVQACPWTLSREYSLGAVRSGAAQKAAPSPSAGQLEWPRQTCTKVGLFPGHGCTCQFPFCDHSHHPIYNLGPHHDLHLLRIGHGQYDKQQDVLIVALDTWDL